MTDQEKEQEKENAISQIKDLMISIARDNEEFLEAQKLVKKRTTAENRIKELAKEHTIMDVTAHDDDFLVMLQFNISTTDRVCMKKIREKVSPDVIESCKEPSDTWRKAIIISKKE